MTAHDETNSCPSDQPQYICTAALKLFEAIAAKRDPIPHMACGELQRIVEQGFESTNCHYLEATMELYSTLHAIERAEPADRSCSPADAIADLKRLLDERRQFLSHSEETEVYAPKAESMRGAYQTP